MVVFYVCNPTMKIIITKLTVPTILDILFIKNLRFFREKILEKT